MKDVSVVLLLFIELAVEKKQGISILYEEDSRNIPEISILFNRNHCHFTSLATNIIQANRPRLRRRFRPYLRQLVAAYSSATCVIAVLYLSFNLNEIL